MIVTKVRSTICIHVQCMLEILHTTCINQTIHAVNSLILGGACTLQDVLVFVSGASAIPPTGLDSLPHLSFHDVSPVPTANVCALSLFLPIQHETYKSFKDAMLLVIFGFLVMLS